MLALAQPLLQFLAGHDHRVYLPAQRALRLSQRRRQLPECQIADEQEIDITVPVGRPGRQGAEDRCQAQAIPKRLQDLP